MLDRHIDLCKEQECVVTNTMFQHKDIHRYTWEDPTRQRKSIIDLLIMRRMRKTLLMDVRVYRQPECASNHHMVVGKVCFRNVKTAAPKIDNEIREYHELIFKTDLLNQYSIRMH